MTAEDGMARALMLALVVGGVGVGFIIALFATTATHFLFTPVSLGWFFAWLLIGATAGGSAPVCWALIAIAVRFVRDEFLPTDVGDREFLVGSMGVGAAYGSAIGAFVAIVVHHLATPLTAVWAVVWLALAAAAGALALPAIAYVRRRRS